MNARLLAKIQQAAERQGLNLTPLRLEVLRILVASVEPVKAYNILSGMSTPGTVPAPPTVYRTLDFLVEHGLIHKLHSINAFVPCRAPHAAHTGTFLICNGCHQAVELLDHAFGRTLESRALAAGFVMHRTMQTLEVHGVCRRCTNGK